LLISDDKIPAKATLIYDVELLEIDLGHRPTNFFGEIDTDGDNLLSQDEVLVVIFVDFCTFNKLVTRSCCCSIFYGNIFYVTIKCALISSLVSQTNLLIVQTVQTIFTLWSLK